MSLVPLPSVELYDNWQDWARALLASLALPDGLVTSAGGTGDIVNNYITNEYNTGTATPPAGWQYLWYNSSEAQMYLGNATFDPPAGSDIVYIDTANIADAAIEANKIAAAAVTNTAILDGVVTALKIATDAVGSAQIAAGAVGTAELASLAVTNAKIGSLAVQSANIADAAVISAKIGSAAVLSANIGDLQVSSAKIAAAAVVTAKIADASIVTALIGFGQITNAKIGDLEVNTAKLANLSVTGAKIANLAVGAAHIQLAAITTALIADAQITTAKIADTIQSTNWNTSTKAGWRITQSTGLIEGRGITLYGDDGSVAFGSGVGFNWQQIYGIPSNWVNYSNPGSLTKIVGNSVVSSLGGGSGYQAAAHTIESYQNSAYIMATPVAASQKAFIGLTQIPGGGNSYNDLKYAWFTDDTGIAWVYESGSGVLNTGGYDADTVLTIGYDGANVRYYKNGILQRTVAATANQILYGKVQVNLPIGAGFEQISFGPYNQAAVIGSTLLGQINAGNIGTYIASGVIGQAYIATASIGAAQIIDLSVGTAEIAAAAITQAKIASLAVGSAQIIDANIIAAKIAALAVQNASIGDLQVNTIKIANNAVSKLLSFYGVYNYTLTAGGFQSLSPNANASVLTENASAQQVWIIAVVAMNRAGSDDDLVQMRILKNGAVALTQQYTYAVQGQNFTYAGAFIDPSPGSNSNNSYQIQLSSNDQTVIKTVTLTGVLLSK
jgi:hypothetical protein